MTKLPQISTKGGDSGTTSLWSGERVAKNSLQIEVIAELDLFDSSIGLLYSKFDPKNPYHSEMIDFFLKIQDRLVQLKGEIATSEEKIPKFLKKNKVISPVDVDYLEKVSDKIKSMLESEGYQISGWISYGEEGELSAWLDYIRALCRKSEVCICKMNTRNEALKFINRLSDTIYWIARFCRE